MLFSDEEKKVKNFPEKVNKVLYRLAVNFDFYLMNNVTLIIDNQTWSCSHLLISDKYVYCFDDRYFKGDLEGAIEDKKWVLYDDKTDSKEIVTNPIYNNRTRSYMLNVFLTKDPNIPLVIPVTVINNGVQLPSKVLKDSYSRNEIVHLKNLYKFIVKYEDTLDEQCFDSKDLQQTVTHIKAMSDKVRINMAKRKI